MDPPTHIEHLEGKESPKQQTEANGVNTTFKHNNVKNGWLPYKVATPTSLLHSSTFPSLPLPFFPPSNFLLFRKSRNFKRETIKVCLPSWRQQGAGSDQVGL